MDGFNNAQAPSGYQEIQWLADTFVALMGLGWVVNYALMIWHSTKGETYSMALLPLCNNIGWELVYTLVYPSSNKVELAVFAAGVTLNVFIMATAARSARMEWSHSHLVADHAALILLLGTFVCFTGHVALALEIGPALAYSWGAVICQLALSIGGMCQLLQRNSTRGTSWTLWYVKGLADLCNCDGMELTSSQAQQISWLVLHRWLCLSSLEVLAGGIWLAWQPAHPLESRHFRARRLNLWSVPVSGVPSRAKDCEAGLIS